MIRIIAPPHHSGVISNSTFDYFIPSDQATAIGNEKIIDLPDKPALHFMHVFQTTFLQQLLDALAALPLILLGFVATDMDNSSMYLA